MVHVIAQTGVVKIIILLLLCLFFFIEVQMYFVSSLLTVIVFVFKKVASKTVENRYHAGAKNMNV